MKISDSNELFNQSAMHFLAVIISLVKANFTKNLNDWKELKIISGGKSKIQDILGETADEHLHCHHVCTRI